MICPNCGHEQPDQSAMCSHCGSKFRFLHGHGDPAKMRFMNFSNLKTSGQKWAGGFLLVFAVLIFAFAAVAWILTR
ncbi:hypothetical protein JW777_00880 [bacterium]|nr:hypothetical protein [bacterium]